MNGNIELLNYIHQNTEMGLVTIRQLIDITQDEKFKKNLESQYNEYSKINNITKDKLHEVNKDAKDISDISKASASMMISMKTLVNKSPSYISEMLIQGSTMGTIDMTKNLNKYQDADSDILDLAHDLLEFEQRNIEELKEFLH